MNKAMPLSLSLPLTEEPYQGRAATAFFDNLLPEAAIKSALAKSLNISEKNDLALLRAVGGECAGAITLLPANTILNHAGKYQLIKDNQLADLIAKLPQRPFLAGEKNLRLSLAGAQSKLPIYFKDKKFYLPEGSYPSSHILKPPTPNFSHSVENELFCMRLAARLKLSVPEVTFWQNNDALIYVIKRHDRQQDVDNKIKRLHQEDFCQALGIFPEQKYEEDGGPNLPSIFELLNKSISPAADKRKLLEWLIFNYLIGNNDNHAKNISLLLDSGPKLAPFYDLLCTAVYENLKYRMAFKIGGENRHEWIRKRHWERLAEAIKIKPKLIVTLISKMINSIEEQAQAVKRQMVDENLNISIVDKIIKIIQKRSSTLSRFTLNG